MVIDRLEQPKEEVFRHRLDIDHSKALVDLKAFANAVHGPGIELVKVRNGQVLESRVAFEHAPETVDHTDVNKVVRDIEELEPSVGDCHRCEQRVEACSTDEIPAKVKLKQLTLPLKQEVRQSIGAF